MPFTPDVKATPGFVPDTANQDNSVMGALKRMNASAPPIRDAQGQVNTTIDPNDPNTKTAMQMGMGPGLNAAADSALAPILKGAGKLIGRGGDVLLQKAVGLKRYIPGLGDTLADEGVIGTKGMMRKQVEAGLDSRGQEIGELAKSIQNVDTQPIAEHLGSQAAKLVGPDGQILPDNIKAFHQFADAAKQASQEGSVTGEVAASRRAQYGKIARDAGRYRDNPAQGLKAQLAGSQQAAYSSALKGAPDAPAGLIDADKAYGALATANKAMAQPESLTSMGIAGKAALPLLGGAVGGAISPDNRLAGAVTGAALSTPLGQSVLGRGLMGLGKATVAPAARTGIKTLAEFLGSAGNQGTNSSYEDK